MSQQFLLAANNTLRDVIFTTPASCNAVLYSQQADSTSAHKP